MHLRNWSITFLAALISSLFGLFALLPLGLAVHLFVVFPLALGVAALFAALAAGWIGTFMATDGTRTHFGPVVVRTEITAAILVLLLIGLYTSNATIPGRLINVIIVCSVLLATIATVATYRLRQKDGGYNNDTHFTVRLLLGTIILVPIAILFASIFGLTDA